MYLKRLEINGFKSFANRTELIFAPGITAVVGPNGSGKSNVTDSIRWVLGEQSAKSLRGAKMEDVIFAGSSSRKPIGFCEVSITFDNSNRKLFLDYAEVTVTRRVYRSGDSEYLLNKQVCRLKDIHELFMDTGIGKEAYSLIGQGRIDEILSTKSEGRRAIFEEAAGIVKYKTRKLEAERKLIQTEENLSRVHDLIYELETQIEPLKVQAERAKQWKETKEELKKHEIGLYVHKIETLHQQWQETSKQVEEKKEKLLELSTTYQTKEAGLQKLKYELQKKDVIWEQVQTEMLTISESIKNEEGKQNVYIERMKQQQSHQESLQKRLDQIKDEEQQVKENTKDLLDQYTEKKQEYQQFEADLARLQGEAFDQEDDDQNLLDGLQQQLQQSQHLQIQFTNQEEYLKKQLSQLQSEIDMLAEKIDEIREDNEDTKHRYEQLIQQLIQVKKKRESIQEKQIEIEKQRKVIEQNEQQWRLKRQKQEQAMERIRSQIELFTEMQKSRDGYYRGVKELLQARDQKKILFPGIYGAVAELIEVPTDYETAIETSLGSAMQHLIVENEQVARNAIAFLKKRNLGRATFVPLNIVRTRSIPESELVKCKQLGKWFDLASRLVKTKQEFSQAIDFLLGLVLVVETLKDANDYARLLRQRYRIVTLDGDVVHPGGSMSGGSRKKTEVNLLGREKKIDFLQKERNKLELEREKGQQSLHEVLNTKDHLNREEERVRKEKEKLLSQEQGLQTNLRELELILRNQQTQMESAMQNHQRLRTKQSSTKNEWRDIQSTLKQQEDQCEKIRKQIEAKKLQLKEQTFAKEEGKKQVTEYKVKLALLKQEQGHLTQSLDRLAKEQTKIEAQKKEIGQEIESMDQQIIEHQQKSKQLIQQIQELKAQKDQTQQQLFKEKSVREKVIQTRDTYEEEIGFMQKSLKKIETEIHEREVSTHRLDVELNHFLQKLAEEYELSFERGKEQFPLDGEITKVEKKVRSLKRTLTQLGEVNTGAIEEFQRLSERSGFLKRQEADLLEAKKTLYEMIEEIEQEMSNQFLEAFEQIRHEFRIVFSQMFGGGEADLLLTDSNQLLETGIEIVAQPPGKRPQYLSLLSGGERALTAIALLFAVLRIKPVPFCVLDEVDAALDDVNLTRFTGYMKDFAKQTQFIIITHRKQTMVGADALYGITMEESGVSKLVSVQLKEFEKKEVAATSE